MELVRWLAELEPMKLLWKWLLLTTLFGLGRALGE